MVLGRVRRKRIRMRRRGRGVLKTGGEELMIEQGKVGEGGVGEETG